MLFGLAALPELLGDKYLPTTDRVGYGSTHQMPTNNVPIATV
jgi:hypothetical protein